jgi:hypothetical protein
MPMILTRQRLQFEGIFDITDGSHELCIALISIKIYSSLEQCHKTACWIKSWRICAISTITWLKLELACMYAYMFNV